MKSTTRFPTSHKWTAYVTPPKGGTKRDFAIFVTVKFNFCRKKSATKFLCVTTSSSKVVATSFLYLTVHRRIAGDVHIYLKFALKVTHPFRKRRFRQISLNSAPQTWEIARKVQLLLIGSRQCAFKQCSFNLDIDEPCALPLGPPKGGSKREFLHLCLSFFVAGTRTQKTLQIWYVSWT